MSETGFRQGLSPLVLGGMLALLPALAHFAPTQLTLLLLVSAALLLAAQPTALRRIVDDPLPMACLAGLLAVSLASAFWAVDPARALHRGIKLAFELAAGLVVVAQAARIAAVDRRPGWILLGGILAFSAVFALDALSGAALSRASRAMLGLGPPPVAAELNQPETLLALLVWPAVAILAGQGRRLAALVLCGAAVAALALSTGGVGLAAFAGGLGVACIALVAPRVAAGLLAVVFAGFVLTGPWLLRSVERVDAATRQLTAAAAEHPGLAAPLYAAAHRLYIWQFAADRIGDRPAAGWGLDAARALPGGKQTAAAAIGADGKSDMDPELKLYLAGGEIMPLHPHNATLQILVELGYLGGVAWLALGLVVLWRAGHFAGPRAAQAATLGMLGTAFAILHFSYGIWQSWWLAALFLAAAAMRTALTSPQS